jgi:hypothetical protein
MNRQWHKANAMPANATMDERIAWHLAHAVHCGCREIPKGIRSELERRRDSRDGAVAPDDGGVGDER